MANLSTNPDQISLSRIVGLFLICMLANCILAGSSHASELKQEESDVVLVATKEIEPFVFIDQGRFTGFSIDL